MIEAGLRHFLDFMGYIASFFIEVSPDKRLFIELAAFLIMLLLLIVCGVIIAGLRRGGE